MDDSDARPTAAPANADIAQIHTLMRAQNFSAALAAGEALLVASPDHRDARLLVAVSQRYLGRIPAALESLAVLERHHPRFSRLYEERGRCYVALRDAPHAIEALLTAVNLNNALPAS